MAQTLTTSTNRDSFTGSDHVTYPRPGIRSAIPVMPAMMLLWEIMTPFGSPVDPLVYMITAISKGPGLLRGLFSELEKTHTHTLLRNVVISRIFFHNHV